MKFIYIDTCVVLDCVFTRQEKASPVLLERIVEACKRNEVKLLLPRVTLLEIFRVLDEYLETTLALLSEIKKTIAEIADARGLNRGLKDTLTKAVNTARKESRNNVEDAKSLICDVADDGSKSLILEIEVNDLIDAVSIAIKGDKPSKEKAQWGLLQSDCLIVAALVRFTESHPDDELIICSSNTSDFADKGAKGKALLHADIDSRLPRCKYYSNPVDLLREELPEKTKLTQADYTDLFTAYTGMRDSIQQVAKYRDESMASVASAFAKITAPTYAFPEIPQSDFVSKVGGNALAMSASGLSDYSSGLNPKLLAILSELTSAPYSALGALYQFGASDHEDANSDETDNEPKNEDDGGAA